ncbi:MAG: hypothetical protein KAT77_00690 [Nanoarchaeota archaeon]|nr:hypothetical protein [Nanoarchaeota archaeon]
MEKRYELIFDEVMVKQLKKAAKNNQIKKILSKMLDKLEFIGPYTGNLLDSQLFIYEIKNKKPPIRLYYKHNATTNEVYVFEFEMKTSEKKQKQTIDKIKFKTSEI